MHTKPNKKGRRALARSVTPPRVALPSDAAERAAYHRRVMKSPTKMKFVLSAEQRRRLLFWNPWDKKKRR